MKVGTRPLATAIALLLVFGVVGLLTVEEEPGSTQLTAAADATVAMGTARLAITADIDALGQKVTMTGEGVLDMARNRGQVTLSSPVFPAPMQSVVDGTITYIAATQPPFQALAQGKPWIAIDATKAAPGLGADAFGSSSDPMQALRLLRDRGIVREIRENGMQDVRGAPTTRHLAEVDIEELLELVSPQQAKAIGDLGDGSEAELEVWLGEDQVVRRFVMRMKLEVGDQAFSTVATTEFFDFGVPVEVVVPTADQVHEVDMASLG